MSTHPWDQQASESDTQYAQFLTYRDLGPSRSLRRAYRLCFQRDERAGRAPKGPSGAFKEAATRHRWAERAGAWDLRNLRAYGRRVAPLFVHSLELLARKGEAAARRFRPGEPGWSDVLATANLLGKLLEPARQAGALDFGADDAGGASPTG